MQRGGEDLSGSNIRIESTETLVRDPSAGRGHRRTGVLIDRGVAFDAAVATYEGSRRMDSIACVATCTVVRR